jgi:AcrR family transcriptional regulator
MAESRNGRSRAEAKRASREALIQAGMELMPARGLDVSLDELCQHAGYTRGAFYVHFDNRDDLILEVMTRVGERMMDTLLGDRDEARPADLFTVASRFLPALFNGDYPLTRHGGMRPYQLLDACHRSERIQARYLKLAQQSIERLAQNIVESQRKGAIRPELDATQLSALIVAMVIGIHTMYDLEFPVDFQAGLQTFLTLVTPQHA